MQQSNAKPKGSSKKLEIGSSVFAKWSGDDVWCRVIIMKLYPDFFNVVFPDYNKLGKVQRRNRGIFLKMTRLLSM